MLQLNCLVVNQNLKEVNMKNFDEERLREEYTPKEKKPINKALALDRKAKTPAYVFAYTFGVLGALILGVGMCLAMHVIGTGNVWFALGIVIGIIGIIMVSTNYPIFAKILQSRKEKYSTAILMELNKKED